MGDILIPLQKNDVLVLSEHFSIHQDVATSNLREIFVGIQDINTPDVSKRVDEYQVLLMSVDNHKNGKELFLMELLLLFF